MSKINLDAIKSLPLDDLMALRVAVNNEVAEIEKAAQTALESGESYPGFIMKPGKKSRCIENQSKYERVVKDALAHEAVETKVIALTNAEKLIKARYEDDELEDILAELKTTYGEKQAPAKLTYVGVNNEQ